MSETSTKIDGLERRAQACAACNSDCVNTKCYNYIGPDEVLALIREYREAIGAKPRAYTYTVGENSPAGSKIGTPG